MRVAILANHPDDPRESMHRFARLLHDELNARGLEASLLQPRATRGMLAERSPRWQNRLDKVAFEWRLRRKEMAGFDVIHVADQGNAIYARLVRGSGRPAVVTCHDLSALEDADTSGRGIGRMLQDHLSRRIKLGLLAASVVVCDSSFTQQVLQRTVGTEAGKSKVIFLGQQRAYHGLDRADCERRLPDQRLFASPFLLHVGANYLRKNRALLIEGLALLAAHAELNLVLAGEQPGADLLERAAALGCRDRIITVPRPSDEMLEALYSTAFAFAFPSSYEGFGWPVIEAQSCGCPVVCSDATCLPEIGGDAVLYHRVDDAAQFARHVSSLFDPAVRDSLVRRGLLNAARFSTNKMMTEYIGTYEALHSTAASRRREPLATV